MHASFHFINQILSLTYTTQACISNFKTYAMQASMKMHISNAINQFHELAPPTCVLLLSKNFDPSPFFNFSQS
jgi:hypothetical protein